MTKHVVGDLHIETTVDFHTDREFVKFTKYTPDGKKKSFILVVKDSDFFYVSEGSQIPSREVK